MGTGETPKGRCHICLDPQCGGKRDCDCSTCGIRESCYRVLRPTVRITTACTQSCRHCCFSCSPQRSDMMSPGTARDVNAFCRANGITRLNVMGGEFACNPEWMRVVAELVAGMASARIVSNGDWAELCPEEVVAFLKAHPQCYMGLSYDRWHTNANVPLAAAVLDRYGIPFTVAGEEQTTANSVVPIGNAAFEDGLYSMFQSYCSKPDRRYEFLIREDGEICKCPMGAWNYDNISGFLDGGFADRFLKFGQAFYGSSIMSCGQCVRSWEFSGRAGR